MAFSVIDSLLSLIRFLFFTLLDPQHLWYFDRTTLKKMLQKAGFEWVHDYSIESEALPYLKASLGMAPYSPLPSWAETKWFPHEYIAKYSESILQRGNGYKIVAIFEKR